MSIEKTINKKYNLCISGLKNEWLQTPSDEWYNYILSLSDDLQTVYMTVTFHEQVFNGGFHQYFVNGYGQFAQKTIESLIKIRAVKTARLLSQAKNFVNCAKDTDEVFRLKLLSRNIHSLFHGEELFEPLNRLDLKYYDEREEDIEQLLSIYLTTEIGGT